MSTLQGIVSVLVRMCTVWSLMCRWIDIGGWCKGESLSCPHLDIVCTRHFNSNDRIRFRIEHIVPGMRRSHTATFVRRQLVLDSDPRFSGAASIRRVMDNIRAISAFPYAGPSRHASATIMSRQVVAGLLACMLGEQADAWSVSSRFGRISSDAWCIRPPQSNIPFDSSNIPGIRPLRACSGLSTRSRVDGLPQSTGE
ncbi:hypothetical protein C8Q72DRAFT_416794 [Fomitopsis betulina]|nr:hypothetical protein C8Q72DRAFT_416794 [Fomitopsis betulina]